MRTVVILWMSFSATILIACGGPSFALSHDGGAGADADTGDTTDDARPSSTADADTGDAAPDDAATDAPGGAAGALGTGGAPSSGGHPAAGGHAGCATVTHTNGLGQTWTDCISSDTHTETQAKKACEAWCAVEHCAGACFSAQICGVAMQVGQIGTGAATTLTGWAWETPNSGAVMKIDPATQTRCDPTGMWE